jgi:hypothetical protein
MQKFVIYNLSDHSIVRLQNEQPSFETIPSTQDWDTVTNWLACDRYQQRIAQYISNIMYCVYDYNTNAIVFEGTLPECTKHMQTFGRRKPWERAEKETFLLTLV